VLNVRQVTVGERGSSATQQVLNDCQKLAALLPLLVVLPATADILHAKVSSTSYIICLIHAEGV
jgi:hypothetical protein